MRNKILLILLSFISISVFAAHPTSFSQAKRLAKKIYSDNPVTFYCGCSYNSKKQVDAQSCGYEPRKQPKRGKRVEWEHVVPAWELGHQLQCWQDGGRKNCRRNNKAFVKMTSDLHNLVPSVGELNGDRSNFRYSMIEGEPRAYGMCDFEVDFKGRKAEPKADRQGDVARIYFYMRDQYGLKLSKKQTQLFTAWSKMDPVDDRERLLDKKIKQVQGNSNCYVTGECK